LILDDIQVQDSLYTKIDHPESSPNNARLIESAETRKGIKGGRYIVY